MDSVANIVAYVLLFTLAGCGLAGWGLIHVSRLPADNPLKRMLYAVSVRVGVTLGVGAVALPVSAIPIVGELWDLTSLVALLVCWLSLIREFRAAFADRPHVFVAHARKESPVAQSTPPALTGQKWVAVPSISERKDKQSPRLPR